MNCRNANSSNLDGRMAVRLCHKFLTKTHKMESLFQEIDQMVGSEVLVTKSNTDVQISSDNRGSLLHVINQFRPSHDVSVIDEVFMDGETYYYCTIKTHTK